MQLRLGNCELQTPAGPNTRKLGATPEVDRRERPLPPHPIIRTDLLMDRLVRRMSVPVLRSEQTYCARLAPAQAHPDIRAHRAKDASIKSNKGWPLAIGQSTQGRQGAGQVKTTFRQRFSRAGHLHSRRKHTRWNAHSRSNPFSLGPFLQEYIHFPFHILAPYLAICTRNINTCESTFSYNVR